MFSRRLSVKGTKHFAKVGSFAFRRRRCHTEHVPPEGGTPYTRSSAPMEHTAAVAALFLLFAARAAAGTEIEFQRQLVNLPGERSAAAWKQCRFADVNGDGLSDLLVLGQAENKL